MPTGREIRAGFLDFFAARDHRVVRSAPIVPEGDPSLLFTNAGMVQFKHIFLGQASAAPSARRRLAEVPAPLAASTTTSRKSAATPTTTRSSRCSATGRSATTTRPKRSPGPGSCSPRCGSCPRTSSGRRSTRPTTRPRRCGRKITDLPPERVLRFDEKDNFWEMGETGPCGPCSEIHHRPRPGGLRSASTSPATPCAVNAGCARYIELWNLVFIQYNREPDGALRELPSKHVDTGMGLERVAAVLQNVLSELRHRSLPPHHRRRPRSTRAPPLRRRRRGGRSRFRVIADHARAVSFMIADGVLPSNEGRGYVLRRILRRAARHGTMLGLDGPFLDRLVEAGGAIARRRLSRAASSARASSTRSCAARRSRFAETLDKGLGAARERDRASCRRRPACCPATSPSSSTTPTASRSTDRGHPARATGITVDGAGFTRMMEEQRARGREAQEVRRAERRASRRSRRSRFVGDRIYEWESTVTALSARRRRAPARCAPARSREIVTAETPFYGESGGQVGDRGVDRDRATATLLEVIDTLKPRPRSRSCIVGTRRARQRRAGRPASASLVDRERREADRA